jgi:hypothetical protein
LSETSIRIMASDELPIVGTSSPYSLGQARVETGDASSRFYTVL